LEILEAQDYEKYEEFVQRCPKGHFMQSRLWSKVKDSWKWQAVIHRSPEGEIIGSMAVLIRKLPGLPYTIMYSPRGPVCDISDKETFRALVDGARKLAQKHKAYVLKMDPDVKSDNGDFIRLAQQCGFKLTGGGKNFEGIQPRFVFRLPVEGYDEESMLAHFHSKTRYNIRVAVKNGVEVKIQGKDALDDFHNIMMETGLRDRFVIRSKTYFANMLNAFGEHARLYMAYYEGIPIAGTLAIHYGDKVWYLYGASSNSYREKMPNYLLQWEMIKWAIEKGCRIYDFRGVSGDLSESNPLYGLYRFKKGFNGELTEFVGEMDLVINPLIHLAVQKGEPMFRTLRKQLFVLKNKGKTPPKAEKPESF
jgi:lipid II:glycine glycyltransferase (peptidoglycan interpeptide bridge formation enzyme)